jgi:hypothetical protein
MERIAAFKPAQSPPEVKIPILFIELFYIRKIKFSKSILPIMTA